ncbi:MAG: chloride channel protein [Micavibrio sp.]|nr:chloride channel protein [Micavibrio sp.]
MGHLPQDFRKASPFVWRARRVFATVLSPQLWRQRIVVWGGAILIGLIAAVFSKIADAAQGVFSAITAHGRFWPFLLTPLVFVICAGATQRWFPSIGGSGIPQAIAAQQTHNAGARQWLLGWRVIAGKIGLTALGLMGGASIGREGPTVQVGAALLRMCAGLKVLNAERALILAGAAAGVAAAFNTPIAGIVFAIEEMARGFHRRSSTVILVAIVLSGASSMSILGNYDYFGKAAAPFSLQGDGIALLVIGILGGCFGALFSWILTHGMARLRKWRGGYIALHPVRFAAACGFAIALIGFMTHGDSYGTGYQLAEGLLRGEHPASWWSAFSKLAATAISGISGIPGGIFSPSLAVGAAMGASITPWFSGSAPQIIILMGMVAYFAGVTQAPITAAIIVLEITGKTVMPAPLIAVAVLAAGVARVFCPVSLYHALARDYASRAAAEANLAKSPVNS